MAVRSSRLLRNISLVFLEPYDVEEIVKGVSKLVPNSATVEMLGEDSGASKHVPCSATEKLDTRYQLPATPAWDLYERENSWEGNARKVVEVF